MDDCYKYFKSGFPKVGSTAPLGAILVSWGVIISKGAILGGLKIILGSKKILKLSLYILELQMKSKKKGSRCF